MSHAMDTNNKVLPKRTFLLVKIGVCSCCSLMKYRIVQQHCEILMRIYMLHVVCSRYHHSNERCAVPVP